LGSSKEKDLRHAAEKSERDGREAKAPVGRPATTKSKERKTRAPGDDHAGLRTISGRGIEKSSGDKADESVEEIGENNHRNYSSGVWASRRTDDLEPPANRVEEIDAGSEASWRHP
jgi:hypothetical protein